MPSRFRSGLLLALMLVLAQGEARGQSVSPSPVVPAVNPPPGRPLPDPTDTPGERPVGWSSPFIASPDTYPEPPPEALPPPPSLIQEGRLDATWLAGGGTNGLGTADFEAFTILHVPFVDGVAPLRVTPYAAARYWYAPDSGVAPGLPTELYDLNVELAWRPRLAEWLFADLAVTPGLYTDFKHVDSESFQMRGRGVAIVAFSRELQIAGGVMYTNRNKTKILPAGGVIWNQSPDTRWFLVFPQPKVSHRFATVDGTQYWGYVAGEFGGGRWEVRRADGENDSLDYTDLRAVLGVEAITARGVKGHADVGYVFARTVNFSSAPSDYRPQSTVMLRLGVGF